jgi:methionyl-tRNA formyltransferase
MGEDVFSVICLKALIDNYPNALPRLVVTSTPVSVSGKKLVDYSQELGIEVLFVQDFGALKTKTILENLDFDFLITAHFDKIVPEAIFRRARVAALNLHPSALPKYRGRSPQHWPIILGDSFTAITVHKMHATVDTGEILAQESVPIGPDMYIHQLQKEFLRRYGRVLCKAVDNALRGQNGEIQKASGASYYDKISTNDMTICRSDTTQIAYGKVRAFSLPYRGAIFAGRRILRAKPVSEELAMKISSRPNRQGWATHHEQNFIVLRDGCLLVTKMEVM